jgi:hypothetical protein
MPVNNQLARRETQYARTNPTLTAMTYAMVVKVVMPLSNNVSGGFWTGACREVINCFPRDHCGPKKAVKGPE